MTRGGFFDPDYARDKATAELRRRVSALEQRLADVEAALYSSEAQSVSPSEASAGKETRDEPISLSLDRGDISSVADGGSTATPKSDSPCKSTGDAS